MTAHAHPPVRPLPAGCILRPLGLADEAALQEFFHSHSEETIFQRYHHSVGVITHERALDLLGVDQQRDIALAVVRRVRGEEQIVAIGRYYTDPDERNAEMAVVVRESMRRRGLATLLLHALGTIAHRHGLIALRAQVLSSNVAMKAMIRPYASHITAEPADGTVCFILPVSALAGSPGSVARPQGRSSIPHP